VLGFLLEINAEDFLKPVILSEAKDLLSFTVRESRSFAPLSMTVSKVF
jgi:hypothetical protein